MEIPTELAQTINGALQDPLSKSIVYTFTLNQTDKYTLTHGENILDEDQLSITFPYSPDTFWIQIRSAYYVEDNNNTHYDLCYMLQITYDNGQVYYVTPEINLNKSTWQPLKFSVPSIKSNIDGAKLIIKAPNGFFMNHKNTFRLFFLGFQDLYSKSSTYAYINKTGINYNSSDIVFIFDYSNPNTDSIYDMYYADLDNSHRPLYSID